MTVPESAPRFYSVAQAAAMLGMSTMTLYRAIKAEAFPAVRIRGRLIVPAKAIEAMVELAVAEQTVVDAAGWVAGRSTTSLLNWTRRWSAPHGCASSCS